MRKAYEKPKLYAESFVLTEHIASCRVDGLGTNSAIYATFKNGNADGECTFVDSNLVLFYNSHCDMDLFDDPSNPSVDELGIECYNAFSSAGTLFSS